MPPAQADRAELTGLQHCRNLIGMTIPRLSAILSPSAVPMVRQCALFCAAWVFFALGLTVVAGMAGTVRAQSGDDTVSPVVVELFTSQGCSSCPPAEAFLSDLARRDDLIALEYHIDYWDYIGWKDPFAHPRFTRRQRDYAASLGARYVYTPQIVVDGAAHEVGSRREAVENLITAARATRRERAGTESPRVHIHARDDGKLAVTIRGRLSGNRPLNVLLVGFDREHATRVRRGENTGRHLVNSHVVRGFRSLGLWRGGERVILLDPTTLGSDGGCAVLLQGPQTGHIAAAGMWRF